MQNRWLMPGALGLVLVTGCGSSESCGPGEESFEGRCVLPWKRYEPTTRIDANNVVVYGEMPKTLQLPDPPNSGFRLIVPPRTLERGEEWTACVAWEYPKINNEYVYAARLYATQGLHHSNMFGMAWHDTLGPSPYPACNPGQSDIQGNLNEILAGIIPDVLFANSTQILGGESVVFLPGMAFKLNTAGREITTSIHFLNTGERQTVEVVYDFYTAPKDRIEHELVPFYFDNFAFSVPPRTSMDVSASCPIFGGNIVSVMPHTHERATEFVVDLIDAAGGATQIYQAGQFDLESDIKVYPEPIPLDDTTQIRHRCSVSNDLDQAIEYGLGTNEMCTLFGYMYPPQAQTMGVVYSGTECLSQNIGSKRPLE